MTTDLFDRRLGDEVVRKEGGYVNDPRDSGGETNWGITVAVARANGYAGRMRDMTRAEALRIYKRLYFVKPGFDQVAATSEPIAAELFDTGVNMGVKRAGEFLQQALNGLNNGGKLFADVDEDGVVGGGTRRALAAYLKVRGAEGEKVLLKALNVLQGAYYIDLARRRPKDETFLYGWLRTRVSL